MENSSSHLMSALLSAFHAFALAIGLPAIVIRARSLAGAHEPADLKPVFRSDAMWGFAAVLWLVTGPARAFGPFEKGTLFYLGSQLFWLKVGLFAAVFVLEIVPMVTLIRWRIQIAHGDDPDLSRAGLWATVSWIQAGLVVAIVFVAAFMARGYGMGR
jgi:putative membrane protein